MQTIKNIIFDLGGIFIEIDFSKTEKAFKNLGVANFKDLYSQHNASPVFELLETGALTPKEFYNAFREATGTALYDDNIRDAWNAMLGNFYLQHLPWLKKISERYNIYLYSNTNEIHYNAFTKIFQTQTGEKTFDDYFIKAYYSHNLKLRKPYKEGFLKIIEEQHLTPSETLFIDDTYKNIEGAQEAGLQTIYLAHPQTVLDLNL